MIVLRRVVASLLILAIGLAAAPARAVMLAAEPGPQQQRVLGFLERTDVRAELAAQGVDLGEARLRVAALTDAEAAELAGRIDSLPAGGIGVLGVALVVFLVLLLTDILGYTKIFPFTKPARS
jgi:hypothetical protein